MDKAPQNYSWKFQGIAKFEQVLLTSDEDIRHLDILDPKQWVALSCPVVGLEFDERALTLLDTDSDGRIRIPEVLAATTWMAERLTNLDSMIHGSESLSLAAINIDNPEGARLRTTAQTILSSINQPQADTLTRADISCFMETAAEAVVFNGDGILPASVALPEDVQQFIKDALSVMGGVTDASTAPGINEAIATAFVNNLQEWQAWHHHLSVATCPLGTDTDEAWTALQEVKDKIDDYFMRTELASYAPQALSALNVDETTLLTATYGLQGSDAEALSRLPLSKITADAPLNLTAGLNPVWREKIQRFARLLSPLLPQTNSMSRQDWENIQRTLTSYAETMAQKPVPVTVEVSIAAESSIEALGEKRITEILHGDVTQRFFSLLAKDSQAPVTAANIVDVEKLVIFHQHLYRLLMNFVSFRDFFDLKHSATFQAGKLYIDGRCCQLCVHVTDVAKHAELSSYSELFLLYCECTCRTREKTDNDEKILIAAAVTAGTADLLLQGRNGVFVDNHGQDWDATVIKMIAKPINLREAAWSPYKRAGRFITEQINKWAGTKEDTIITSGVDKVVENPAPQPAAETAAKFDIGRSVGIFAAIGLAIGAIGTALASIARALFELQWWQFPLVVAGLFLLISGPSMIIAWLKLRQRTLVPLLEASGWAINSQLGITWALGNALTTVKKRHQHIPDITNRKSGKKSNVLSILMLILILCIAIIWFRYGETLLP